VRNAVLTLWRPG